MAGIRCSFSYRLKRWNYHDFRFLLDKSHVCAHLSGIRSVCWSRIYSYTSRQRSMRIYLEDLTFSHFLFSCQRKKKYRYWRVQQPTHHSKEHRRTLCGLNFHLFSLSTISKCTLLDDRLGGLSLLESRLLVHHKVILRFFTIFFISLVCLWQENQSHYGILDKETPCGNLSLE